MGGGGARYEGCDGNKVKVLEKIGALAAETLDNVVFVVGLVRGIRSFHA